MSAYEELTDDQEPENGESLELRVDSDSGQTNFVNFDPTNGLRGLCALMIASGHFFDFFGPDVRRSGEHGEVINLPYLLPVTMFFILSGTLYGYLYHDKWEGDKSCCCGCCGCSERFRRFVCKRYIRLAPMVLLGIVWDLGYFWKDIPLEKKILNTPATLGLISSGTLLIGPDGPTWQISAMFLSYLALPLLINHFKPMANLTPQFWLYSLISMFIILPGMILPDLVLLIHMLYYCRVWQFIVGIICGIQMKRNADIPGKPILVDIFTFLWFIYWFANFFVDFNIDIVLEFLFTPLIAGYIYHLCLLPSNKGIVNKIFSTRVFQFLGNVSFALYCLHWGFFYICGFALHGTYLQDIQLTPDGYMCSEEDDCVGLPGIHAIQYYHIVWIFPLLIGLSWIAKVGWEDPCKKYGERIFLSRSS